MTKSGGALWGRAVGRQWPLAILPSVLLFSRENTWVREQTEMSFRPCIHVHKNKHKGHQDPAYMCTRTNTKVIKTLHTCCNVPFVYPTPLS